MTYRLKEKAQQLTLAQWRKLGGCGLTHWGEQEICASLRCAPKQLESRTLGELARINPGVGRTLARFAQEHLPGGLAEEESRT